MNDRKPKKRGSVPNPTPETPATSTPAAAPVVACAHDELVPLEKLHQTGDLHQPLHVTALVSEKYPKGDRGGNEFYVIPAPGRVPSNIHSLWDGYGVKRDTDLGGGPRPTLAIALS